MRIRQIAFLCFLILPCFLAARTIKVLDLNGKTGDFDVDNLVKIEAIGGHFRMYTLSSDGTWSKLDSIQAVTFSPVEVGLVTQKQLDKQRFFSWKSGSVLFITFQAEQSQELDFQFYDLQGHLLEKFIKSSDPGMNTYEIPLSEYPKGIYICRITEKNGKKTNLKFSL